MKMKYFGDTDTLYIEFRDADLTETRDLDENTLIDIDGKGQICAITIEHASVQADISHFSFEHIPPHYKWPKPEYGIVLKRGRLS